MGAPLLEIRDLKVHFPAPGKPGAVLQAVNGVDLQLNEGEVLGLVGESGCGKSTLARAVLRLVDATEGAVFFEGQEISRLRGRALRPYRPQMQMIFQDPHASLNPRRTVFDTLAEPLVAHGRAPRRGLEQAVAEVMEKVGLARRFMQKYPHEFSGGQRQRIAIARALILKPRLIVADEPVSALDVSVQAQILNLLHSLCREENLAMLLISHDLSVVNHMARRIAVMYLGKIVEEGPAAAVYNTPLHPYTRALISAIPRPEAGADRGRGQRILLLGDPPSPVSPPAGCAFHPRCPWATAYCADRVPPLALHHPDHRVACTRVDASLQEAPRVAELRHAISAEA